MSAAEFQPRHAFGMRASIPGCVIFTNERTIVYACGKNLVVYNIETHSQQLINYATSGSGVEGITAVAITPNRRFLAVAEQGETPLATVWDLQHARRRKVIQCKDVQTQTIVSMCFSPDSKYLVTQGGRPDWVLTLWNWEKPKSMAAVKSSTSAAIPVHQVLFNPVDNTQVSVVGDGILRVYRYSENSLKPSGFQKVEPKPNRCQYWLTEEKLLVGTDQGEVMLYHKGERKECLDLPALLGVNDGQQLKDESGDDEDAENAHKIYSILPSGNYIFVSFNRRLAYCERSSEGSLELLSSTLNLPLSEDVKKTKAHDIINLVKSPGDEIVAAVTRAGQIYSVPPGFSGEFKGGESRLARLVPAFHSAPITGLSVCVRKPIVATCSMDRQVLIWNYEDCVQELEMTSKEDAYSVALHPTGLYILVGFADKLRLMGVHIDDLKVLKAFTIRACRECVFSNGGQYIAATNGNLIQVFNTHTYEMLVSFKGHSNKIRGLVWSPDDRRLISCGLDGCVYEWLVDEGKRGGECIVKGNQYSSVAFTPDQKNTLAVCSDNSIKEITTGETSEVLRSYSADMPLIQIVGGNQGRVMFAGTSSGSIHSLKCPLTSPLQHVEVAAHSDAVAKIALSHDGQHLFTAGDDGTLYFFKINSSDGLGGLSRPQFSQDVLIPRNILKEKDTTILDLTTRVDELRVENEYQMRLKTLAHNEVIMEMTEKFHKEMDTLKKRNVILRNDKEKIQSAYEKEKVEFVDAKAEEFMDMEASNNMKLMDEYEKYEELQARCQRLQEQHVRKVKDMAEAREAAQRELRHHYEEKLRSMAADLAFAEDKQNEMRREFEEMKAQIEEDCDREILDDANVFETKMREAKEQNIKLAGEAGVMKKKVKSLAVEITDHKTTIEKLQNERSKLQGVIKTLEKDIAGLKKEMAEREDTIADKERQIADIRKKNQELEKFKFVLDFKIKELKKQIEPRDAAIARQDDKIARMEAELQSYEKSYHFFKHKATHFKEKLDSREKEMKELQEKILIVNGLVKRIKKDIHDALPLIQNPTALKKTVIRMGNTYLSSSDTQVVQEKPDDEVIDAQKYLQGCLERSKGALENQLEKDSRIHRDEKARLLAENVQLLKEINELRGDLKSTRTRVHDLEVAAKSQRLARPQQLGSAGSVTNFGSSPMPAYGTAVSLPMSRDVSRSQTQLSRTTMMPEEDEIRTMKEIIAMQKEELQGLRARYRGTVAGTRAVGSLFPPITNTATTTQG